MVSCTKKKLSQTSSINSCLHFQPIMSYITQTCQPQQWCEPIPSNKPARATITAPVAHVSLERKQVQMVTPTFLSTSGNPKPSRLSWGIHQVWTGQRAQRCPDLMGMMFRTRRMTKTETFCNQWHSLLSLLVVGFPVARERHIRRPFSSPFQFPVLCLIQILIKVKFVCLYFSSLYFFLLENAIEDEQQSLDYSTAVEEGSSA